MSLEIGSIVRLKSGGPYMTIESFEKDNYLICIWFNDNKELQKATFNLKCIGGKSVILESDDTKVEKNDGGSSDKPKDNKG